MFLSLGASLIHFSILSAISVNCACKLSGSFPSFFSRFDPCLVNLCTVSLTVAAFFRMPIPMEEVREADEDADVEEEGETTDEDVDGEEEEGVFDWV